jgi:ubiquitin-like 1-activating enzyme E1 B
VLLEYAGNIIPAIATTNAIVAGAVVLQALHVLRSNWSSARMIWLARSSTKILSHTVLSTPNPYCSICKVVYVPLAISSNLTLGEFVSKLVIKELGWDGQVTVQEGARILWESEDFEDNGGKKMSELGLTEGCFVNVLDDDEPHLPVSFSISCVIFSVSF